MNKTTDNIETKTTSKSVANVIGVQQSMFPIAELIQPKLTIGQPNDKYEQEADRVAESVINMPDPVATVSESATGKTSFQTKPLGDSITPWIQKQELEEDETIQEKPEDISQPFIPEPSEPSENIGIEIPFTPDLTTKTSVDSHSTNIQRLEEEEEELQTKVQRMEEEEELQTKPLVQTKIDGGTVSNANRSLASISQISSNQSANNIFQTKFNTQIPNGNKGSPLVQPQIQGYRIRDPSSFGNSNSTHITPMLIGNIRDGPGPVQRSGSQETLRGPPMNKGSTSTIEQNLNSSRGNGMPMSENTQTFMASRFGRDFSNVRIHTGQQAREMSNSIHAQAFTHGNNIYFNQGKYNPDSTSGKQLLAHELTHTIQQGASSQNISPKHSPEAGQSQNISQTGGKRIQRGWLDSAWDSVSGAVSGAVEWAADQLSAGIEWIKGQARSFVTNIPGYRLFTVAIGYDPVSRENVDRSGRNFIEAGIDIIPGGAAFKQKLEEEGAIAEAAAWLDEEIAKLNLNPAEIGSQISRFFSGLSVTDLANPGDVLQRLSNIITAPVQRVIRFAINVASKLLEIVKSYVINSLITFIREQTYAYPLLTVILGRDPVSDEEVERTPIALLRGFMQLSESGQEQLRQMEETGSLERAAEWLDGAVERLNITPEIIRESFTRAWDLVSIESLLNPIDAFRELYNIFAAPIGRIIAFLVEVALKILEFIKDALIQRLAAYARTTRGYPLLKVILGKDPFSQEPVERNTENLVHGFMALKEGGEEQFQEMKQSGAIDRMSARIEEAVASLNFTWDYIRGLFVTAWESFSLSDLANPLAAFARILGIFAEPIYRLIVFFAEIIRIVIEVLLTMMNFPFDLIGSIINHVRQAIQDISRDPIGFLKNLMRAVKSGFEQFFDNILTHLINGLVDWLFGELDEAGISPPTDLSFSSILGLVLEVLGLSMERIWAKLAERIGQERVDRIRGMIDRLTGIWSFIRDVRERGLVAIWEYIQGQLSNLWNIVLDSIRNWIITRIIQQVTVKLLSMLDPTGIMAVVNGFIAFFSAVQSFIRYLREMLEIVNSFVGGIAEIAGGSIARAANFLEGSLARSIPVAIGFLANQVGLGGLGRRISEMIERVREMVDGALDWLIDRAVQLGSGILNMVERGVGAARDVVSRIRNWWSARKQFQSEDGQQHSLYFQGSGSSARLMVASDPTPYSDFLNSITVTTDKQADKAEAINIANQLDIAVGNASQSGSSSESEGSSSESGESDHATNIQSLLNQLSVVTARFMPVSSTTESTPTMYGGKVNGFGSSASVLRLTSKHPRGGSPSVSDNPHWQALRRRMDGGGTYYVRGHLLNDNLGGPGNTWDNLTPLTQVANNRSSDSHLHGFENDVKDSVKIEGKIVNFVVNANYGRPSRSADSTYFRTQGNPDDDLRADIVEAEEKIPLTLSCRANEINPDGSQGSVVKEHQVNNTIDTNRNNYSLSPTPKQTVYLNEMNLSELLSLNGIGDTLANEIISHRPFRTKAQLQSSVHIAEGRWNQMQRTSGKSVRIYRA